MASLAPSASMPLEPLNPNGTWWALLSTGERRIAAKASISTYSHSYFSGFSEGMNAALAASHSSSVASDDAFRRFSAVVNSGRFRYSQTYDFYAIAVTSFYVLHSDRSKIPLYVVIPCLSDNPLQSCDSMADGYLHDLNNGR
jgi:hypothetical protein